MTRRTSRARRAAVALSALVAATAVAGCSRTPDPVGAPPDRTSTTSTLPPDAFGTTPGAGGQQQEPQPPQVAWVSQFGGAGNDRVAGVAGRDRAVVAVGSTDGTVGLSPGTSGGGLDALVATVAADDGTVRALRQYGGAGDDAARGIGSARDADAALACGTTTADLGGASAGAADTWCAPVDADGALGTVAQAGSDDVDDVGGVALAPDGAHGMLAGSTVGLFPGAQDPTGGLLGGGDALVARVDPSGRPVWARQFGTAGTDVATSVQSLDDGDAVAAGTTDGPLEATQFGGEDGWVARFDPFGNLRWITQFGSDGSDRAAAVAGGGDPARGTQLFCAAGSTSGALGASSAGGSDASVAAFDATGDRLWAAQVGSPGDDAAAGVVVDGSTVYVAGTAAGAIEGAERVDLPGAPAAPDGAPGGRDAFLAGFDAASGKLQWVLQFGTTADDEVTSLTQTEEGLLVVGGATAGQLGATPGAGATDGFLVAFTPPAGGGGAASSV